MSPDSSFPAVAADRTNPQSQRKTDRKVCVIDADSAVRDGLSTLIDLTGLPVVAYPTASDFWDDIDDLLLRCVLCEAELPDGNGFELHRQLQAANFEVPFALLVSGNSPVLYRRAELAGIVNIYRKPLTNTPDLLGFIQKHP